MVENLARNGDLRTARVSEAMLAVPRHSFVEGESVRASYENRPLATGFGQTISQPTVVAIMTEALELTGRERVLEIGTGSGYQTAILALLASRVFSLEAVAPLAQSARDRLARLGYANVDVRLGDGFAGWPEQAPFDRVVVTAAPSAVPAELVAQLADGGLLVSPIGPPDGLQVLIRGRKRGNQLETEDLGAVRFVPMEPAASPSGARLEGTQTTSGVRSPRP
jgi:protein-L-isoaspartate(D-aspartate) O-methyltransferase